MSVWNAAKEAGQKFVSKVLFYIVLAVWVLVLALVALVHLHVLPREWNVFDTEQLPALTALLGLLWILFEQTKESKEEIEKKIDEENRRLDDFGQALGDLRGEIRSLVSTWSPQLSLIQCLHEVDRKLSRILIDDSITIDHLGLDMHNAWKLIRESFLDPGKMQRKIKYRLLMLPGDVAELSNLPGPAHEEMTNMCLLARGSLQKIKNYLAANRGKLPDLSVEIRIYKEFPVVHGFRMNKPEKAHYVSFFRWDGPRFTEYDWGEGRYHHIEADSDQTSIRDVADVFDGYFGHLWEVAALEYPPPAAPTVPAAPAPPVY